MKKNSPLSSGDQGARLAVIRGWRHIHSLNINGQLTSRDHIDVRRPRGEGSVSRGDSTEWCTTSRTDVRTKTGGPASRAGVDPRNDGPPNQKSRADGQEGKEKNQQGESPQQIQQQSTGRAWQKQQ